jgi:hypothetical protein
VIENLYFKTGGWQAVLSGAKLIIEPIVSPSERLPGGGEVMVEKLWVWADEYNGVDWFFSEDEALENANEHFSDPSSFPPYGDERESFIGQVVVKHRLTRYNEECATEENIERLQENCESDLKIGDPCYYLHMEPVEEPDPWIKFSERLPENGDKIWYCYNTYNAGRAVIDMDWISNFADENSVAWRLIPKPKPYQGER